MADRKVLTAQVDPDSELYEDFEEYEEGYKNRAEAIRSAISDGIDQDTLTRQEFEKAMRQQNEARLTRQEFQEMMRQQQRYVQRGTWASGVLTASIMSAVLGAAVAVSTILPAVPSFEGIITSFLLVTLASGLALTVASGIVAQAQDRFGTQPQMRQSGQNKVSSD